MHLSFGLLHSGARPGPPGGKTGEEAVDGGKDATEGDSGVGPHLYSSALPWIGNGGLLSEAGGRVAATTLLWTPPALAGDGSVMRALPLGHDAFLFEALDKLKAEVQKDGDGGFGEFARWILSVVLPAAADRSVYTDFKLLVGGAARALPDGTGFNANDSSALSWVVYSRLISYASGRVTASTPRWTPSSLETGGSVPSNLPVGHDASLFKALGGVKANVQKEGCGGFGEIALWILGVTLPAAVLPVSNFHLLVGGAHPTVPDGTVCNANGSSALLWIGDGELISEAGGRVAASTLRWTPSALASDSSVPSNLPVGHNTFLLKAPDEVKAGVQKEGGGGFEEIVLCILGVTLPAEVLPVSNFDLFVGGAHPTFADGTGCNANDSSMLPEIRDGRLLSDTGGRVAASTPRWTPSSLGSAPSNLPVGHVVFLFKALDELKANVQKEGCGGLGEIALWILGVTLPAAVLPVSYFDLLIGGAHPILPDGTGCIAQDSSALPWIGDGGLLSDAGDRVAASTLRWTPSSLENDGSVARSLPVGHYTFLFKALDEVKAGLQKECGGGFGEIALWILGVVLPAADLSLSNLLLIGVPPPTLQDGTGGNAIVNASGSYCCGAGGSDDGLASPQKQNEKQVKGLGDIESRLASIPTDFREVVFKATRHSHLILMTGLGIFSTFSRLAMSGKINICGILLVLLWTFLFLVMARSRLESKVWNKDRELNNLTEVFKPFKFGDAGVKLEPIYVRDSRTGEDGTVLTPIDSISCSGQRLQISMKVLHSLGHMIASAAASATAILAAAMTCNHLPSFECIFAQKPQRCCGNKRWSPWSTRYFRNQIIMFLSLLVVASCNHVGVSNRRPGNVNGVDMKSSNALKDEQGNGGGGSRRGLHDFNVGSGGVVDEFGKQVKQQGGIQELTDKPEVTAPGLLRKQPQEERSSNQLSEKALESLYIKDMVPEGDVEHAGDGEHYGSGLEKGKIGRPKPEDVIGAGSGHTGQGDDAKPSSLRGIVDARGQSKSIESSVIENTLIGRVSLKAAPDPMEREEPASSRHSLGSVGTIKSDAKEIVSSTNHFQQYLSMLRAIRQSGHIMDKKSGTADFAPGEKTTVGDKPVPVILETDSKAMMPRCDCPNATNCQGCSSSEALCIRIEQMITFQPIEICGVHAYRRADPRKIWDLFSKGGSCIQNYTDLQWMTNSSSNDTSCTTFFPANEDSVIGGAAFAQANVPTEIEEDIGTVMLMGKPEGLVGSTLWINGHWIKQISAFDMSTNFSQSFVASIWPRVEVASREELLQKIANPRFQGFMMVWEVSDDIIDFDVPSGVGIEIIGNASSYERGSNLAVVGNVQVMGRLSIKNCLLDLEKGLFQIDQRASLIFQSCALINMERCSHGFEEINGLCLHVGDLPEKASNALENCRQYIDEVFAPQASDITDRTKVAHFISNIGLDAVWIHPDDNRHCGVLYANGTTVSHVIGGSNTICKETPLPPLCATHVKESITGGSYTSYFTNQQIAGHKELFDRLSEEDRLPVQMGATLTVTQNDIGRGVFTITDERPFSVLVNVTLNEGNDRDVYVALENFPYPPTLPKSDHEWLFNESMANLPTKLQVHATGSICIEKVDLLFRNKTGALHQVMSFPSRMFASCLDFNVCSDKKGDCGRSLAFYNSDQECLELKMDDARFPRDLAIDLLGLSCTRLTSWHHTDLGDPFRINIRRSGVTLEDISLEAIGSATQKYAFDPNTTSIAMNINSQLPHKMLLSGGANTRISSISISRYDKNISFVDFGYNSRCIYLCDTIANDRGLMMGPNKAASVYLSLLESMQCNKIDYILNSNRTTGREVCTAPPINVSSVQELQTQVALISPDDQPFRSLLAYAASDDLDGVGEVIIPENRGLTLISKNRANNAVISGARFVVKSAAKLSIVGFHFGGTSSVVVESNGEADIESCGVSLSNSTSHFLINHGSTSISSTEIKEDSVLANMGFLNLIYVSIYRISQIDDAPTSLISVSRLKLHEGFGSFSDLKGNVRYPDAERLYTNVSPDDTLCSSTYFPNATHNISSKECKVVCEDISCSGFITSMDEETFAPQCALCEQEACSYNCSNPNRQYSLASSKFFFASIQACLHGIRPLTVIINASLEQCKMYCTYYETCEGFRLGGNISNPTCELIAELDLDGDCNKTEHVYIPFLDQGNQYLHVNGTLTNASLVSTHSGLSLDECYAVCAKTLNCASFLVLDQEHLCELYDARTFLRDNITTSDRLFISATDSFPHKRYMTIESCTQVQNPYETYNAKIRERCQNRCDGDESCFGYSYEPFVNVSSENCALFDRDTLIDIISGDQSQCPSDQVVHTLRAAYVAESFSSSSDWSFEAVSTFPEELLLDECQSLCYANVDCASFHYSVDNFQCTTGKLSKTSNSSDANIINVFSLSAKSPDHLASYISARTCYIGEPIANAPVIGSIDPSESYVTFEQTCLSMRDMTLLGNMNDTAPAQCGLLCQKDSRCRGFAYQNNVEQCKFVGGSISFNDCDDTDEISDIYLRAEVGRTCQALCDLHELCNSFVFDDEDGCLLYSDITLLHQCTSGSLPRLVNLGQGRRERDALVGPLRGKCLIEFENTREIGCFDVNGTDLGEPVSHENDQITPFSCQQACKDLNESFYMILDGSQCFCSSTAKHVEDKLPPSPNCSSVCAGDPTQFCGGTDAFLVGETNLALHNLTLGQCKRACDQSRDCSAISFDDSMPSICELHSSSLYDECPDASSELYIEYLEHYYESPEQSFIGSELLFKTTASLRPECQSLCDAFFECEAIRFHEKLLHDNCEILGGDVVSLSSNETDVEVARGTTLFTVALSASSSLIADDNALLDTLEHVFDLDECQALCDAHARCGSLAFGTRTCKLYRSSGFAGGVGDGPSNQAPYYTSFESFVSIEQDFVEAEGLCIEDQDNYAIPLWARATVRSQFDCASRCNNNAKCIVFTYENDMKRNCVLYGSETRLSPCSSSTASTFVMYTRGSFTRRNDAFLLNETSLPVRNFDKKSLPECAALCDDWFGCSSFRASDEAGTCRLYQSEQIVTRGVIVNVYKHPTNKPDGVYFTPVETQAWGAVFGSSLTRGYSGTFVVDQWRDGEIIYTGNVNAVGPSGEYPSMGRRDPPAESNKCGALCFQDGDLLTPQQRLSLRSTFEANRHAKGGNMFTIFAKNNVRIAGLSVHALAPAGSHVWAYVYHKAGRNLKSKYVGSERNEWTQVPTLTGTSAGRGVATDLAFLDTPISLKSGEWHSFHIIVTCADWACSSKKGHGVRYTAGNEEGSLYVENDDIAFYEGKGCEYHFDCGWADRIWNGVLKYYLDPTVPTGLDGNLYTYYSEFHYVKLPPSICVSAMSFISEVSNTPLEACKKMCDKIPTCISFEHDQGGDCSLYSSSDFSATCSANQNRALYIGYKELFEKDRSKYVYKELQTCFDVSNMNAVSNSSITSCQHSCSGDPDCYGVQFDRNNKRCTHLKGSFPPAYQRGACNPSGNFICPISRDEANGYDVCKRSEIERAIDDTCNRISDTALRPDYCRTRDCESASPDIKRLLGTDSDVCGLGDLDCGLICRYENSGKCDGRCHESECHDECKAFDDMGCGASSQHCGIWGISAFLKTEVDPYGKMESTCLRNKIAFGDQILDTEEYECKALCDAHPHCRYFIYGSDQTRTLSPVLRECVMFRAQSQKLEDCNGIDQTNQYAGLAAMVNGRTFIDQITWFGEPEETFAVLAGLSYQECASLCDSLGKDTCSAFVHSWNYRRASSASEPQIFLRTRLMSAHFQPNRAVGNDALFLQFKFNQLVAAPSISSSDDKIREQRILLENSVGGDGPSFKIKLVGGKCIGTSTPASRAPIRRPLLEFQLGGLNVVPGTYFWANEADFQAAFGFIPQLETFDNFVEAVQFRPSIGRKIWEGKLHVWKRRTDFGRVVGRREPVEPGVFNYGDEIAASPAFSSNDQNAINVLKSNSQIAAVRPACQNLELKDCTHDDAITFQKEEQNGRIALSYDNTDGTSGCLRVRPIGTERDYVSTGADQSLVSALQDIFDDFEGASQCRRPAQASLACSNGKFGVDDNSICCSSSCSQCGGPSCHEYDGGAANCCQRVIQESGRFCGNTNDVACIIPPQFVFSSSYGEGCHSVDDSLVQFPLQLFAFASDPVLLQNDVLHHCISKDLNLISCTETSAVKWTYVFEGGELFYADATGGMMCLTDTPGGLSVTSCDSRRSSFGQSWNYNSVSNTIELGYTDSRRVNILQSNLQAWSGTTVTPGKYFSSNEVDFESAFGFVPVDSATHPGTVIRGRHWRRGVLHWEGNLRVWRRSQTTGVTGKVYGRYEPGEEREVFRDGDEISPPEASCLVAHTAGTVVELGSCNRPEARWSQYSECRLNTRVRTRPMNLERISDSQCLNEDGDDVISCANSPQWRYYYDKDNFRLQMEGEEKCFGRSYVPNSGESTQQRPTGTAPCPDSGDGESTFAYYTLALEGEENNQFKYNLGDGVDYCVKVPQSQQQRCADIPNAARDSWRRFGSAGDATEISVRPGLILQDITDPEKLRQLWLQTAEGKRSRVLRAKMARLVRKIQPAMKNFDDCAKEAQDVLTLIDSVQMPSAGILETLNMAQDFFGKVAIILQPLEYIPYVGPFVRGTKLRFIAQQTKEALYDGTLAMDGANAGLSATTSPLGLFVNSMDDARQAMVNSPLILKASVAYVTRNAFDAHLRGDTKEYERMMSSIDALTTSVETALNMIGAIENMNKALGKMKSFFKGNILGALKRFKSILGGIESVIGMLSFVNIIDDFELCVNYPNFRWKWGCIGAGPFEVCASYPSVSFSRTCVSMKPLGDLMGKIENAISSIPGVGHLWNEVNDLVGRFISGIFEKVGFEIPTFKIPLGPLDDAMVMVKNSIASLSSFTDAFKNIVDFEKLEFMDTLREGSKKMIERAQQALPDISNVLNCTTISCLFPDNFPVKLYQESNRTFPIVEVEGTNYSAPQGAENVMMALARSSDLLTLAFTDQNLGNSCSSLKTVNIHPLGALTSFFGITPDELGLGDPGFATQICSNPDKGTNIQTDKTLEPMVSEPPFSPDHETILGMGKLIIDFFSLVWTRIGGASLFNEVVTECADESARESCRDFKDRLKRDCTHMGNESVAIGQCVGHLRKAHECLFGNVTECFNLDWRLPGIASCASGFFDNMPEDCKPNDDCYEVAWSTYLTAKLPCMKENLQNSLSERICTRKELPQSWGIRIPLEPPANIIAQFLSVFNRKSILGSLWDMMMSSIGGDETAAWLSEMLSAFGGFDPQNIIDKFIYWLWFRGNLRIPIGIGTLNILNLESNLIIGCDSDNSEDPTKSMFQIKTEHGPFFSFSTRFPPRDWEKSKATTYLLKPGEDKNGMEGVHFNEQMTNVEQFSNYVCDMEFIWSTFLVLKEKQEEWGFPEQSIASYLFESFGKIIGKKDNDGNTGSPDFASCEPLGSGKVSLYDQMINECFIDRDIRHNIGKYAKKLFAKSNRFDKVAKAAKSATFNAMGVRALIEYANNVRCWKLKATVVVDPSLNLYHECVPNPRNWYRKQSNHTCAGPGSFGSVTKFLLNVFKMVGMERPDKGGLMNTGFNWWNYTHLFGSKMTSSLKFTTMDSNFTKEESSAPMSFSNPSFNHMPSLSQFAPGPWVYFLYHMRKNRQVPVSEHVVMTPNWFSKKESVLHMLAHTHSHNDWCDEGKKKNGKCPQFSISCDGNIGLEIGFGTIIGNWLGKEKEEHGIYCNKDRTQCLSLPISPTAASNGDIRRKEDNLKYLMKGFERLVPGDHESGLTDELKLNLSNDESSGAESQTMNDLEGMLAGIDELEG